LGHPALSKAARGRPFRFEEVRCRKQTKRKSSPI
jgi:hypothetical protein